MSGDGDDRPSRRAARGTRRRKEGRVAAAAQRGAPTSRSHLKRRPSRERGRCDRGPATSGEGCVLGVPADARTPPTHTTNTARRASLPTLAVPQPSRAHAQRKNPTSTTATTAAYLAHEVLVVRPFRHDRVDVRDVVDLERKLGVSVPATMKDAPPRPVHDVAPPKTEPRRRNPNGRSRNDITRRPTHARARVDTHPRARARWKRMRSASGGTRSRERAWREGAAEQRCASGGEGAMGSGAARAHFSAILRSRMSE